MHSPKSQSPHKALGTKSVEFSACGGKGGTNPGGGDNHCAAPTTESKDVDAEFDPADVEALGDAPSHSKLEVFASISRPGGPLAG
mmetsp:Transcript_52541/g.94277  ORF Transcript_52541/g.94277 Transcript_52541/m.94277 type:complete len:85 (+) Transcript_52541:736-990(+)